MNALRIETMVDEALVKVIPALRPLLGHRAEIIALDQGPEASAQPGSELSLDEFIATRPEWPKDRPPVTLEEMEQAIVAGALRSGNP